MRYAAGTTVTAAYSRAPSVLVRLRRIIDSLKPFDLFPTATSRGTASLLQASDFDLDPGTSCGNLPLHLGPLHLTRRRHQIPKRPAAAQGTRPPNMARWTHSLKKQPHAKLSKIALCNCCLESSSPILTPQMPESLKPTSRPLHRRPKHLVPGLGSQPALSRVGQATLAGLSAAKLRNCRLSPAAASLDLAGRTGHEKSSLAVQDRAGTLPSPLDAGVTNRPRWHPGVPHRS